MAKQRINPSIGDIDGKIGELVFYHRKGKPCIRRTPIRQKPFTPAEQKHQIRFKLAAAFASAVLADPQLRVPYENAGRGTDRSAQNLAIRDFFRSPSLAEIDLSLYTGQTGQLIRVRAEEGGVGAESVTVAIADGVGTILELGPAVVDPDGVTWWYSAHRDLPPGPTPLDHRDGAGPAWEPHFQDPAAYQRPLAGSVGGVVGTVTDCHQKQKVLANCYTCSIQLLHT